MNKLEIEHINSFYFLKGMINEFSDFRIITKNNTGLIRLDMGEVKAINSTGGRNWVESFYDYPGEIHLFNCPPPVIDQFNLVPEFIGPETKVKSFFCLFYCDACDHDEYVETIPGENFFVTSKEYNDENLCPLCYEQMQEDFNRDDYFLFLDNC